MFLTPISAYSEIKPVNDIAIISVTVFPTSVEFGEPVSINVTVVNQGDFGEIFNVTVSYYCYRHHQSVIIDTRMGASLGVRSTTTLLFTWYTTEDGRFTLSAEASVVPGEIDTADNVFINGEVTVSPRRGNVRPKAKFTLTTQCIVIVYPLYIHYHVTQFVDQSFDPDGSIVSWLWEFGDGTTSTDQNPTHRYEAPGTYTIKLTVTDDDGAGDYVRFKNYEVYDTLPPASVNDYHGLWHTEDFTIAVTATDDYSKVPVIYYKMNDGPTKSVQVDGQPRITTDGNNKLEYWSVDEAGNEETHHIIDVKLDKTAPVADAGGDRSVTQNVPVIFDASKSSDNLGIVSYEWDFEDGSRGTGLTTTHTYKEPGTYVVWLTVEDAAGNKNTRSVSITVLKDTDGDRTPDTTDIDDDDDGMPDTWELSYGLDPFDATDAALDPDRDGLSNLEECRLGTDPIFYFSPFPGWIIVLIAAFGTIFFIIRYAITRVSYEEMLGQRISE